MSKTAQEIITEALESLGVSGDAVKLPEAIDPQERVQAFRVTAKDGSWSCVGISRDGQVLCFSKSAFALKDGGRRFPNNYTPRDFPTLEEIRRHGIPVEEWEEPFLYEAAKAKGLI